MPPFLPGWETDFRIWRKAFQGAQPTISKGSNPAVRWCKKGRQSRSGTGFSVIQMEMVWQHNRFVLFWKRIYLHRPGRNPPAFSILLGASSHSGSKQIRQYYSGWNWVQLRKRLARLACTAHDPDSNESAKKNLPGLFYALKPAGTFKRTKITMAAL